MDQADQCHHFAITGDSHCCNTVCFTNTNTNTNRNTNTKLQSVQIDKYCNGTDLESEKI